MPRHKDIRYLETCPVSAFFSFFWKDNLPGSAPILFPLPILSYLEHVVVRKKKKEGKIMTRLNRSGIAWMNERQTFRRKRVRQAQRTHSFHATRDSFSFPFCSSEMTKTWVHLITSMCIKLTLPPQFCLHRIEFLGGRGDRWPFHLLSGEKKEGFSFFLASFRLFHHLGCN